MTKLLFLKRISQNKNMFLTCDFRDMSKNVFEICESQKVYFSYQENYRFSGIKIVDWTLGNIAFTFITLVSTEPL